MKRQAVKWEKILANYILNGILLSRIYKELSNETVKKINESNQKNGFHWVIFYIQKTSTRKEVQHIWPEGICQLKPQWDITHRMAKRKVITHQKLVLCITLTLLGGVWNGFGKQFLGKLNAISVWLSSSCLSGFSPQEIKIYILMKIVCKDVHSSFTHSSSKLETTQMPFCGWALKNIGAAMPPTTTQ